MITIHAENISFLYTTEKEHDAGINTPSIMKVDSITTLVHTNRIETLTSGGYCG